MKLKYCGIRRIEDINYVNEVQPDYIGFVFAPSKRQVTLEQALELRRALNPGIQVAGVFVNEAPSRVAEIVQAGVIDIIQLHGDEDAEYLRQLRRYLDISLGANRNSTVPIIKAIRVRCPEDIVAGDKLEVDYLLLDKYDPKQLGGTGEAFDWQMICPSSKPIFLAGGITRENLKTAMELQPYGIDVSSGIETEGYKDITKMKQLKENFELVKKTFGQQNLPKK